MQQTKDERMGWTSASNALPDALCQGRHLYQKDIPEPERSKDAEFGTRVHSALELSDPSGLDPMEHDIYESCLEIEKKMIERVFGPEASKVTRVVESRFWVKVPGPDGATYMHSGRLDRLHRLGKVGLIIEFKTLPGDQSDSPVHMQLRDQVVLASGAVVLDQVWAAVVQPLVTHDPDPVVYEKDDIRRARDEMFLRVRASNTPNAPRNAGNVQCAFCRAKHICPEYAAWQAGNLPAVMAELDIPVALWTPDQRAVFCERKAAARKWLDDCEAQIKLLLKEDRHAVPGFKLGKGRQMSAVEDLEELYARFEASGGSLGKFMSCLKLTKKDFTNAVKEVTSLKGKGLNEKVDQLMDGLLKEWTTEPSIEKE